MSGVEGIYERPLTARFLFQEAARTYRARFRRVLAVALVIALASSLIDFAFDEYASHIQGQLEAKVVTLLLAIAILVTGANSFGSTFLAGVLDKTVGEHQHGHRKVGLGEVFRTLPFLSLIGADLLVSFMRGAGWLLFLVPGFVAVTLTAVVGPVIVIEQRRAVPAIRRSIQLIRPVFWLAVRAATLPLMAEGVFDALVTSLPFAHGLIGHLAVSLFLEVPVASFVALVEVSLAYHLIERDRPGSISSH